MDEKVNVEKVAAEPEKKEQSGVIYTSKPSEDAAKIIGRKIASVELENETEEKKE